MINLIPDRIEINTTRCLIKNMEENDIEDICALYSDEITRKYLGGVLSKDEAKIKVKNMIDNNENVYAIRDLESNEFIGLLYLSKYYDNTNIELSYELLSSKFGYGYASECLLQMLNYLKEIGIRNIVAETQKKNTNSIKLLLKLGYKKINELVRFDEEQIVFEKTLNY